METGGSWRVVRAVTATIAVTVVMAAGFLSAGPASAGVAGARVTALSTRAAGPAGRLSPGGGAVAAVPRRGKSHNFGRFAAAKFLSCKGHVKVAGHFGLDVSGLTARFRKWKKTDKGKHFTASVGWKTTISASLDVSAKTTCTPGKALKKIAATFVVYGVRIRLRPDFELKISGRGGITASQVTSQSVTVHGRLGLALPTATHKITPQKPVVTASGSAVFDALIGAEADITAGVVELDFQLLGGIHAAAKTRSSPAGVCVHGYPELAATGKFGVKFFEWHKDKKFLDHTWPIRSIAHHSTVFARCTYTPPKIITTKLPAATAGKPYTAELTTADHRKGTWKITAGKLPAGLSLTGYTITGTPATAGTGAFTLKFTDAHGRTATATATITIAPAQPAVYQRTTQVTPLNPSSPYSQWLKVSISSDATAIAGCGETAESSAYGGYSSFAVAAATSSYSYSTSGCDYAEISPDGKYLVYEGPDDAQDPGTDVVRARNLATGQDVQWTQSLGTTENFPDLPTTPDFMTPDGGFLVYTVENDNNGTWSNEDYLLNTATLQTTLITNGLDGAAVQAGYGSIAISGNGQYIAYVGSDSTVVGAGNFGLYILDRATGVTHLVTATDEYTAYAGSGSLIVTDQGVAYIEADPSSPGSNTLDEMNNSAYSYSGGVTPITPPDAGHSYIAVSGNGRYFLEGWGICSGASTHYPVKVVDADTGTAVTVPGVDQCEPNWMTEIFVADNGDVAWANTAVDGPMTIVHR